MAHFLTYKTQTQKLPFEFNFTTLLTSSDTALASSTTLETTVTNSAGENKKDYLIQSQSISGKVLTVVLVNGVEGEDYLITVTAIGDVSGNTLRPTRVLELRVRNKLIGNL